MNRVTIAALGLPAPVLAHEFFDAEGFVARVDFWWPALGVVGEFDGRVKYFDPAMSGGDPARVVYAEKLREDRLRALVAHVVRWGWPEAVSAQRLGPRLAAAGLRSRRGGRASPAPSGLLRSGAGADVSRRAR